ncbi:hypothetical protein PoB_006666400 [Plakobranchus ocellatus]|uniref:Uncharacterized protein n=1 Tax=Plakobranchus ocellatus TaxID=259542 RepID=A0AAV4D7I8_9GAST|nr:hypothetical protein PoB_006666400 [Plakobranchus ocellatus]
MQVLEARWRLFGQVLRRDRNIPANKAMLFYFSDNKRARGRPLKTLPITLNNEWNALVAEIRKTAEAARSDDPASGRL